MSGNEAQEKVIFAWLGVTMRRCDGRLCPLRAACEVKREPWSTLDLRLLPQRLYEMTLSELSTRISPVVMHVAS